MRRRQSLPRQWLIADSRLGDALCSAARRLPLGSGILLLRPINTNERRLRNIARLRRLTLVEERRGVAARVHNTKELREALLAGTPLILLSPLYRPGAIPGGRRSRGCAPQRWRDYVGAGWWRWVGSTSRDSARFRSSGSPAGQGSMRG